MVTLKSLELRSFLSHDSTLLRFKKDEKLLIDGASGSGKSSIVDAIIWALYGVGRVDNKSLILSGATEAQVTLDLEDGDIQYRIIRNITKAGKHVVMVQVDGKPVPTAGTKETQKYIEDKILHCSYELFINSVAYPQGNQESFVMASNARRKELLLEIIGVNDIDTYYESARNQLAAKELEEAARVGELAALKAQMEPLALKAEKLPEIKKQLEEAEEYEKVAKKRVEASHLEYTRVGIEVMKLGELEGQLDQNQLLLGRLTSDANGVKFNIEKNRNLRPVEAVRAEITELLPKEEEFSKVSEELNAAVQKNYERTALIGEKPSHKDYDEKIDYLKARLKRLTDEQPDCPSGPDCPYMARVGPEKASLEAEIARAIKDGEDYDTAMADWTDRLGLLGDDPTPEISARLRALQPSMEKLKNLRTELDSAEKRDASMATERAKLAEIDTKFQTAQEDRAILVTKIQDYKDRNVVEKMDIAKAAWYRDDMALTEAQKNVSSLKVQLGIAEDAVTTFADMNRKVLELAGSSEEGTIKKLKLMKEAFGSTGIKALAVDYMIPRLEDKINEVLAQMSDFRVQLDTQKKSQADTTIEGLFITIRNERGETFDFASYSGGEKLKITVAISEALASLQKVGFRILDELFVGLDEDSTESFATVLAQVQSRFSQMLCISHLRSIKDIFDSRVTVVKLQGKSTIHE